MSRDATSRDPLGTTAIPPDPAGLGERFMAAFTDIEAAIRRAEGERGSFAEVSRDYFVARGMRQHLDALGDFADLRNTLAHGRHFASGLLATPAPEVVAQIERLRDLVVAPPTALSVVGASDVVRCGVQDRLEAVLPKLAEHGYGQLPVYDGSAYVGLFTYRALARWLAAAWSRLDGVGSTSVREVLEHAEPKEAAVFVAATASVPQVVAALSMTTSPGTPAVIITRGGKPSEPPLAIATAGDLGRLVAVLRLA